MTGPWSRRSTSPWLMTPSCQSGADELAHGSEIGRNRLTVAHERDPLANEIERPLCPHAQLRGRTELDRLGRDDELDRNDALAQGHHLRDSSRRERRERDAVFDPFRLRRARELERHGVREQPRLARERLTRVPVLGEPVLVESLPCDEAVRETGER